MLRLGANKHRLNQTGVTIIEMVLLLLIIGALSALIYAAHATVQRNYRNQLREKDINAIYQQLEAYYVEHSQYPTLADMNTASWVQANLPNLPLSTLKDPSGKNEQLAARPKKYTYAYQVSSAGGAGCNDTTTPCAHYTLTATLQDSPQKTYVKSSLN